MLNRELILAMPFKSEVVNTPSGDIRVRVLSGLDRERFEKLTIPENKVRATWIALAACNDDGTLMFQESDIDAINGLDSLFLVPVFAAIMRINGLAKDSIEQSEKN